MMPSTDKSDVPATNMNSVVNEGQCKQTDLKHPTSSFDTLMHLIKGNIGSGFLAIPYAFKSSGLLVGTFGMVFIAVICVHCMHMVVKCSQLMCKETGKHHLDYASTAEQVFDHASPKLRKFAPTARLLTNFYLCVTQLGFCSVYFILVANNVELIVDGYFPMLACYNYRIYVMIMLIPIILMCLTKTLKFLVPASAIANLLLAISTCIVFYYLCRSLKPVASRKLFTSASVLPEWLGTVVYAFEGIGLILPLKNNMKHPKEFGGVTGVLNVGMSLVSFTYIAMGFFGYLQYGDEVLGSVTLNLPHEMLADSVRIMVAIMVFLTYPIQFFVPIQIMWPTIENRIPDKRWHHAAQKAFRVAMVLVTFGFAMLIPQLGLFISLIGAFAGCYLSLITPPVLDVVITWSRGRSTWYGIVKNVFIFSLGILGLVTGTYVSLNNIIRTFS